MQPNLSTTIVLALYLSQRFLFLLRGLSYKICRRRAGGVCFRVFFYRLNADLSRINFPFIHSYQLGRIMGWLYPEKYPDIAYQQQNSIMAIGSGLLWGKGLGNDDPDFRQERQISFLEPQNDFYFSP